MKRPNLSPLILLLILLVFATSISAQAAVTLKSLRISLWPEFDDPDLLVLIDGELAEPGQSIRVPVPANSRIHAVATLTEDKLVDAVWESAVSADGGQVITLTVPDTVFRVEYYAPLPVVGDARTFDFRFPANYLSISAVQIEVLLPPAASAAGSTPELTSAGTTETGALIYRRSFSSAESNEIIQKVSYNNPTGALSVAEDARQAPAAAPQPAQPTQSRAGGDSSVDPLLVGLAIAAVALIGAGAYGLWRTRQTPDLQPEPVAPQPRRRAGKGSSQGKARAQRSGGASNPDRTAVAAPSSSTDRDQFCRSCGTGFNHDDAFCRKCGTKRP